MKKLIAILLSLVMILGLFAGCGASKGPVTAKVIEIELTQEEYAFGVDKNQPELLEKTNAFIAKIMADGTFEEICNKYFAAAPSCTTEERMRVLRLIENMCLGSAAVGYRTESLHGAGSPQAQRIMIQRQGNLAAKKELAKAICGITK